MKYHEGELTETISKSISTHKIADNRNSERDYKICVLKILIEVKGQEWDTENE